MKGIEQFKQLTTKQIALGVGVGLVVSLLGVTLFFSVGLGYPIGIEPYQYDYPNGTNPTTPITAESVNVHGSGVALSNPAYAVQYHETNTIEYENGTSETYKNTTIDYQINNRDGGQGYMERQTTLHNLETGAVDETQIYVYENNEYAFIHNNINNTTTWAETGNQPLVISNQLELPQQLLLAIPHASWTPTGTQTINNSSYLVYEATSVNANQMQDFTSVSSFDGRLLVNQETGVITYDLDVTGTTADGQTVHKHQSLTYDALPDSDFPTRPSWAERDDASQQEDDDDWTPPY